MKFNFGLIVICLTSVAQATYAKDFMQTDVYNVSAARTLPKGHREDCEITVRKRCMSYFHSILDKKNPSAIYFHTNFGPNLRPNITKTSFRPGRWLWTYTNTDGYIPYLAWGNDYKLLSFGLLNARTFSEEPTLDLDVAASCPLKYGDIDTTYRIVAALGNMTAYYHKTYQKSYYCFMAEVTYVKQTVGYAAALYFLYPQDFINFNCCYTYRSYVSNTMKVKCSGDQVPKWLQFTLGPYIIGLIFVLYFPIIMFYIAEWVSTDEIIHTNKEINPQSDTVFDSCDKTEAHPITEDLVGKNADEEDTESWVYLDGQPPYSFLDVFSPSQFEFGKRHPVLFSRLKRLLCILFSPCFVYIHVYVYYLSDMQDIIDELIDHKAPLGFLSLVGTRPNRSDSFAPKCGGPFYLLLAYHILGIAFIVLPRSLKQIIENGMPVYSGRLSPLFLNASQILYLSKLNIRHEVGYKRGAQLCICGIHMVFSDLFWRKVIDIQTDRLDSILFPKTFLQKLLRLILLPLYLLFCFAEIILCVVGYGIPFLIFLPILVRGLSNKLATIQVQMFDRALQSSSALGCLVYNPLVISLLTVCLFSSCVYFVYVSCLIFVEGFVFIAEVFVFTFAAVLLFPGVAFGSIFFFTAILYYFVCLIQDFGNNYLELLTQAIDVSLNKNQLNPRIEVVNNELIITNVSCDTDHIIINDVLLELPEEELQLTCQELDGPRKIRMKNDKYGIPRRLFDYLIKQYMPPNQFVLQILFKFMFVCGLTVLSLSYMNNYLSGTATGLSNVMHVVFVLIVGSGAPHFFEMTLGDVTSVNVEKEAELIRLRRVIEKYYEDNQ